MSDPFNAFGGRHGGWGAPHVPPDQTPPGMDRAPKEDPDKGFGAGDVDGDYRQRWYEAHSMDPAFLEWLHRRWAEEFAAWRSNNPTGQPGIAPPQAVMTHNPPEEALARTPAAPLASNDDLGREPQ